MEYQCEYCGKPFFPKRTDSLYCSHSCRQLAYVLRKATMNGFQLKPKELKVIELSDDDSNDHPSIKENTVSAEVKNFMLTKGDSSIQLPVNSEKELPVLTDKEKSSVKNVLTVNAENDMAPTQNELSVKTDIINVNTDKNLSVKTDAETIKTDKKIPVNTDKENVNTAKAVKQEQKMPEPEFKEYYSRFLNDLDNIHKGRDNWMKLDILFSNNDTSSIWVSVRYRCLIECLLAFSEMKQLELDDLKEVCNELTRLIQSWNFNSLHPSYPYIDEIKELRERVRNTCIKAGENEWIKYRLNKEQKQYLIISRFELSQFVPKKKFSELSFKEKQLNRKEE